MNIFTKLTILSLFLLSFQCTYVDKEISKSQKKEKTILERYLGKKSSLLKSRFGNPEKIVLIHHTKYIFIKSQLIITCERNSILIQKKTLLKSLTVKIV